jgi:adenosylhomocysteinase
MGGAPMSPTNAGSRSPKAAAAKAAGGKPAGGRPAAARPAGKAPAKTGRPAAPSHDVADLGLAARGAARIGWAAGQMPVLAELARRFAKERTFQGVRISACLHVTSETANLVRALVAGGADVLLCASNPLSTQDDVAAALVAEDGVAVHAVRGEDRDRYWRHVDAALAHRPHVTIDDGADLVSRLHESGAAKTSGLWGSLEETTTGVIRLRSMARDGALEVPVVAVNDALCKHLFDNRYGTGQSTIDGVIRATNVLLAGRTVVVAGYGWCGKGVSMRARGLGANVVVTEIDPVKAIEAALDGHRVMPMGEAAPIGDVFVTVTGNRDVVRLEHFRAMKDGAIVCNSGHFDVEVDVKGLEGAAERVDRGARPALDTYVLPGGKRVHLLAEGRLVNLAAAEGHPAAVMDMSFSVQALTAAFVVRERDRLETRVHTVPEAVDREVASLKLATMGLSLDRLTKVQERYLASWREGT